MAKPKKEPLASPLASPLGRAFLEGHLAHAREVLRTGPGGTGWLHNETKRAEAEERAAFLQALVDSLPK